MAGFDFVNGIAPFALHETGVQVSSSYANHSYTSEIAAEAASADVAHSLIINSALTGELWIGSGSVKVENEAGKTYSTGLLMTSGSTNNSTGSQLFFRNGILISSSLKYDF